MDEKPKKLGRKKIQFDEQTVKMIRACAERGWSNRQIAASLGISHDVIDRNFTPMLQQCRQHGDAKLLDQLYLEALGRSDEGHKMGPRDTRALIYLIERRMGPLKQIVEMKESKPRIIRAPRGSNLEDVFIIPTKKE